MINTKEIEDLVRSGFTAETAVHPEKWSPDRPSTGQCLVASLFIWELTEAGILMAKVNRGEVHYWNLLDGIELDITRDQFDEFIIRSEPILVDPYVKLKNKRTKHRLELLMDNASLYSA